MRAALVGVVAGLSGAGLALTLAAGPAGAQTAAAPPQPGVTLGVAGEGNERLDMFYTGTDHQVWMVHMSPMGQNVPVPLGGRLIGGPAAVWVPPGVLSSTSDILVFGRGTDNRLWLLDQGRTSRWVSLGGVLTSKPTASIGRYGGSVVAMVRGSDGAVWDRVEHTTPAGRVVWEPWAKDGGRLLPGTAPAAARNNAGLFVAVVGTDRAVWVASRPPSGQTLAWHSIGGRTTSNPGLATPSDQAVVAFARGTTANAAWYKEFVGHTPGVTAGWHSLGGTLTSGLTALTQHEGSVFGPTSVFALGADSLAWMDSGTWPALTGWTHVRVG